MTIEKFSWAIGGARNNCAGETRFSKHLFNNARLDNRRRNSSSFDNQHGTPTEKRGERGDPVRYAFFGFPGIGYGNPADEYRFKMNNVASVRENKR